MTLAEKYNEAMNKIELSAEARARILGNLRNTEADAPKRGKVVQFPQWKRWAALAACAAVVLLAAVALNPRGNIDPVGQQGSVQIANPLVDYATLADAAKAAGFELTAPETVEGYSGDKTIQVVDGSMIQIIYSDNSENRLFVRKQAGDADISGDYNDYAEIKAVTVNGCDVTLRGSDGKVSTAIWTSGGYSYAVSADVPMTADAMTALIAQVA